MDKAIWLFAGGTMQKPVVDKIKARGFKVILTDFSADAYCRPFVDEFVHLDVFDLKSNVEKARELKNKYEIVATIAAGSDCCEGPAVVAEELGIHGVSPEVAKVFRYKNLNREILTKAGIPQPKFGVARNLEEAKEVIDKIGLPVAFKSTNNAGSRGFTAVNKKEDITQKALDHAIDNGTTGLALIEELLIPVENEIAEQSVETLWYEGKMHWLNWVDRMFRKDMGFFPEVDSKKYENISWAVEIGHVNPALHSEEITEQVKKMVEEAGLALGLGDQKGGHIMKADIMITKKGPYILEPTLRLSGGWDSAGSTPARGADFIGGAIEIALGKELTEELWREYFQYKDPDLYSAVMSEIPKDKSDCIGRRFALASDYDRQKAVKLASDLVDKGKFIV